MEESSANSLVDSGSLRMHFASRAMVFPTVLLLLTSVGCAGLMPMGDGSSKTMVHFCDQALERVRNSKLQNNAKNKILYYTQLATYENACREFVASTQHFAIAKEIARDQYGISVTEEATKFLINDASGNYKALNYERAFFPIYNAINYAVLGNHESALVEARQIDFLLSKLAREQGDKNVYSEDAFGRYMTAMLYQESGNIDDANVSYLQSLEAYRDNFDNYGVPIPDGLMAAAMQVAEQHSPQAVTRVSEYGVATARALPSGAGEVVFIHQVGLVPKKIEEKYTMAFGNGLAYLNKVDSDDMDAKGQQAMDFAATLAADDSITVAFPKFVTRDYLITDVSLIVEGAIERTPSVLVENIGRIAMKDLDDHKARIYTKTIARAVFFYAMQKLIEKELRDSGANEFVIQLAINAEKFRQAILEKADIRQWESLPDQIRMGTIVLPAGEHTLKIRRIGGTLPPEVPELADIVVTVEEGRRTFVSIRTAS